MKKYLFLHGTFHLYVKKYAIDQLTHAWAITANNKRAAVPNKLWV